MGKRQKAIQETATAIIIDTETAPSSFENSEEYSALSEKLAEIRKIEGVIGYILRDSNSATIDLDDPDKTVEYALASSKAIHCAQRLSEEIDIKEVEFTIMESQAIKALFIAKGENRIDIFMQKTVDHNPIINEFSP